MDVSVSALKLTLARELEGVYLASGSGSDTRFRV